jgi:hypothetical protein
MRPRFVLLAALATASLAPGPVRASLPGRVARAAADHLARRLGRVATRQGTEILSRRIERLAARHGDEVLEAVRHSGPGAVLLIERAGAHGGIAARLLARHGSTAARTVARPHALALVARHGDDAALALLRHGPLAEPLIARLGAPAARALAVSARNARRLVMLDRSGELTRIGRTDAILDVVGRSGDRALDFVWRHKGALVVGTVLATFLNDPGPFLDGTRDLAGTTVRSIASPIVRRPSQVVETSYRWVDGLAPALIALAAFALGHRYARLCRSRNETNPSC